MNDHTPHSLLDGIHSPADLKHLTESQLETLAAELRAFLIETVSRTGGHLAAGLGTVELTIALHKVFHTPQDRLVWDVGHQSYPHKILTGRREAMAGLRKRGGIAGFPRRAESPYDSFGTGHSSTSISAALGMAIAARQQGLPHKCVAIIGDGALGAGMAYEALNHAGDLGEDLLVILNDNDMSISQNVGGMSNYLTRLLSGPMYNSVRERGKRVLSHLPPLQELARRTEEHVKGMIVPGTLFEELGFHYFGPVDGHDIHTLVRTLQNLRPQHGPRLLHVVTRKGKGYAPAENNPSHFHGVSPFKIETGIGLSGPNASPTYTQVFSDWLCAMAAADPQLVGVTPAMCEGSGLVEFAKQYPDRYFDVGIAEQHAVTLAAGLACEGQHPVVAIYSTFLQRGYDQLIHDVALQNLPVLFAIDRAGLVGADGPTHAGSFDLSYLRCIPNMLIMAPADEKECWRMLSTGHRHQGPAAVRYPRGCGPGVAIDRTLDPLPVGQAELRRSGHDVALLAFGCLVDVAVEVAEALDASLVNMRFVKPLDIGMLRRMAEQHRLLVTLEENAVTGGAGSAINEWLQAVGINVPVLNLGLPDRFIEHAQPAEMLAECGLDAASIRAAILAHPQFQACQSGASRLIS